MAFHLTQSENLPALAAPEEKGMLPIDGAMMMMALVMEMLMMLPGQQHVAPSDAYTFHNFMSQI